MEPAPRLHPELHLPRWLAAGRLIMLVRLVGIVLVDVEVALTRRHAASSTLLVVLAVLANAGAVAWLLGRSRGAAIHVVGLALMAAAGGLLASLQHGSAALALPAIAVPRPLPTAPSSRRS